jgi:hypothetical protein
VRKDLEDALVDLQRHAGDYVSLSRLQLAIKGLREKPGQETVRIAILGLGGGSSGRSAKELLRLMLADPLMAEQDWERQLEKHDTGLPIVVRLGDAPSVRPQEESALQITKKPTAPEINVPSVSLKGSNIEILIEEVDPFESERHSSADAFEEDVLAPRVGVEQGPAHASRTPVHRSLLVADGILGATTVVSLPSTFDKDEIATAVNLRRHEDDTSSCPFMTVDIDYGSQALATFRQSVGNAMQYESLWYKSNLPSLFGWMKLEALNNPDGRTKQPVRKLVGSVLRNATAKIDTQHARQLSKTLASHTAGSSFIALNKGLADWAEAAHQELQNELDRAFTGRRWRKLNWWKLFWRVDDVSMLSSEMVLQRFLPSAEKEVIYLSGKIEEAARSSQVDLPGYSAPVVASSERKALEIDRIPTAEMTRWPAHIPFTRRYILEETIPALQALAQKLVLQTTGTTAATSALAALTYLSSYGIYEAGAVGALGLVWSLGRMQKKWETAREFWEDEIREEGRKAVRAVEASVAEVLDRTDAEQTGAANAGELERVRELVERAQAALAELR